MKIEGKNPVRELLKTEETVENTATPIESENGITEETAPNSEAFETPSAPIVSGEGLSDAEDVALPDFEDFGDFVMPSIDSVEPFDIEESKKAVPTVDFSK